MIALIAAVPFETELLRRRLAPCEVRSCGRRDLYRGTLFGHPAVLLHSGVGKAGAAAAATVMLEFCRPTVVLVLGCGGAYPGSSLDVGDLALATEEVYGDEGVLTPEGFRDLEELGFPTVERNGRRFFNRFAADPDLLRSARPLMEQAAVAAGRKLAAGPLVTVSTCSGTKAAGLELARRTGGICENMEGAAVAQVCALHGTPFLEIRGISNLTEDRDLASWDLKGAAEMAQQAVKAFLGGWPQGGESA
jgi:futalosine hydrolase